MITISTDVALLDVDRIHQWLSEDAYWSLGRTRESVERSLTNSVNYGAYDDGPDGPVQIGYLRIVTDHATFAWICDVYVEPAARGRGIGKLLMAEAHDYLARLGVRRAILATSTAHGLYEQYGFTLIRTPEIWMERSYE